jgi:signal transduction histidine kinase
VGLRAKLSVVFLSLLVAAVLLVSAVEIDRTVRLMVDGLDASATTLINQTFNQIEIALSHASADPVGALRRDPALAAFLASARAFSEGVIYVRLETLDGALIAGTPTNGLESKAQPFGDLTSAVRRWSPIARVSPLWGDHVYELTRTLEVEHHVLGIIRVGLSNALLTAKVRQKLTSIGIMAATVITVSFLAAMLAGVIVLRPVAAIIAGIERLTTNGNTYFGLDVAGGDELGKLAEKFNLLSRRVSADRAQWEDERGQFINIFRSIADAVLLLDADGTIRFCNEEALTRLGLPGGGLAKSKALSALLQEGHPLVGIIRTAKASATELRDMVAEVGRGKAKLSFLVSVFPLGVDPARAGQLVILRDLKPLRQLKDVVDNSSRLARLGGLISGVAHQIRNPLNAMTLELELLSQDVRDSKPVDDRVQTVRNDMLQLAQAIDALTRFMRPESLKPELVSANEFVTEAAKVVVDPLVRVVYSLDPANPAMRVDRAVLMEAVRNVVQNAVEAMPNGGKLKLTTEHNDGFVDISLADTGHGIPAEILDRVLQLYFTTKESGTGLGLPMALRAVDLHGGMLTVDSKVNAGTVVKIRLPAESAA